MYSSESSSKHSIDMLPNRWGSDEGEGRQSKCLPDPTTTLRSNPNNLGIVRLHPSTFRLERTADGRSRQQVVLPEAASRSSRATTFTPTARMVNQPLTFDGTTTDTWPISTLHALLLTYCLVVQPQQEAVKLIVSLSPTCLRHLKSEETCS